MMTLGTLYEYAENNSIRVDCFNLHNKKAFAIQEESGERAIVLDKSKIEDSREEKVILSEELGHLDCAALLPACDYTNPLYSQKIRKAEYRARAWSYEKLLPYTELAAFLRQHDDFCEAAEHFEVPFSFLIDAINYYKRKGGFR